MSRRPLPPFNSSVPSMSELPKLCAPNRCVGCGACRAKCPNDAISTPLDANGFFAPKIDVKKCVGCRRCETACPVLNPPTRERFETPDVFACWNNDEKVRSLSSSGGMFSVYATSIIERGGVVFGVALDDDLHATFVRVQTIDELAATRSSKYVQADSGTVYRDVETELKRNRPILFSGTPCQVAGLYSFLGKDFANRFANLFTCDLVCRGVPSPLFFEKWLRYLEERFGGRIFALNFRDKSLGGSHSVAATVGTPNAEPIVFPWFDNRATSVDQAFVANVAFANISLRESCSNCPFKFPRVGDVTLGDFWGLGKTTPFPFAEEIEKGVSLNLINGEQGRRLAAANRDAASWNARDLSEATSGNPCLIRSVAAHPKRQKFLRDLQTLNYEELAIKYRRFFSETPFHRAARRLKKVVLTPFALFSATFSFRRSPKSRTKKN